MVTLVSKSIELDDKPDEEQRDTLTMPANPTAEEVHRWFQAPQGTDDQEGVAYPGWAAQRMADIKPGPVKVYTKEEIVEYEEKRRDRS